MEGIIVGIMLIWGISSVVGILVNALRDGVISEELDHRRTFLCLGCHEDFYVGEKHSCWRTQQDEALKRRGFIR